MENWKKALIYGSLGAGALLLISGRRNAGIALTVVGGVVLAAEHPDKVETLWRNAPEYLSRGSEIVQAITRIAQRLAEEGERYGLHAVREAQERAGEYIS